MPVGRRNVTVQDFEGTVLAAFWQHGSVSWSTFHHWLREIIVTDQEWAIFDLDKDSTDRHGARRTPDAEIVPIGDYILLLQEGSPLPVTLIRERARPRNPTHTNTPVREQPHYRDRTRERDQRCLVTGYSHFEWIGLQAAHIFPRAHGIEWTHKGYHELITDDAPPVVVGGPSKINSVQNCMLLRADIHLLWNSYQFGVNPDDNYRITAFSADLGHINGLALLLDHIVQPNLRPLDVLFRDHFRQAVLKNVKGAGEPTWDYEDTFGDGAFDLSKQEVWGSDEGKERLELAIVDRLFEHQVAQELNEGAPVQV